MNADHVRQWTTALREPGRRQITGALGVVDEIAADGTPIVANCCLGVVEEITGATTRIETGAVEIGKRVFYNDSSSVLSLTGSGWLGVRRLDPYVDFPADLSDRLGWSMTPTTCADLNDTLGLTFTQIADVIDYFGITDTADTRR